MGLMTWLRGMMLLRHPEMVQALGEMRLARGEIDAILARNPGAEMDHRVLVKGMAGGTLELGRGVRIEQGTILSLGDEVQGHGRLVVGEDTWVGQYNNFRTGNATISTGNACLISQFCTLVGANHILFKDRLIKTSPLDTHRQGVVLGDDVWLGVGVSVMPGLSIGKGAVIGANSVVTKAVPEYEIWAGVPARKIGERK